MKVGIPLEIHTNENMVASTPDSIKNIIKLGFDVVIESQAGIKSYFTDQSYKEAGAKIVDEIEEVFASDIVLKVNPPEYNKKLVKNEPDLLKQGSTLICFVWPAQNKELLKKLMAANINVLAMDCVPRLSRSQSLDALSSMANIIGYKAIIESSNHFGRFLGGQITAAGHVPPAKVLVIGAGVAGLSAIGTAGNLGAIVRAFDTRVEVKEQVHSLGAEFLEINIDEDLDSVDGYAKTMSKAYIDAEMKLFVEQAKDVDIIITTALIPGKPAPKLITKETIDLMKPGSIIVDLAAQTGGNCELCKPNEIIITDNHVTIIGYTDLSSRLSSQSSRLYSTNLVNLLKLLTPEKNGQININFDDSVIRGVTIIKEGKITWPAPPIRVSATTIKVVKKEPTDIEDIKKGNKKNKKIIAVFSILVSALIMSFAPKEFLGHLNIFVLSCVIGYYVVWNVTHSLHTPLMSVTNAISGIVIVGAILQLGSHILIVELLAFIAVLIVSINIFGGFFVTKRMLKMFKK